VPRIALKDCGWERVDDRLIVVSQGSKLVELHDPDGSTEAFLTALAAGPQTVDELRARLAAAGSPVSAEELADALAALDSIPLLEDPDGASFADAELDLRHFSNLAFFQEYSGLQRTPTDLQRRLVDAHVLQLGTGGLGSNVLQCLAGLGVGRLTLLDADVVEPRNFARQFIYRRSDVGKSKVEAAAAWVREFDDRIEVRTVERRVTGPGDVADLLDGVDVVSSGIDTPAGMVDLWVNEACMSAAVPWVRGGATGTATRYFSVHPGRSACFACRAREYERVLAGPDADGAAARAAARSARINRAIGPMAALVGSQVALEVIRYLTGFEPPVAAGATVTIDIAGGLRTERWEWPADPSCALCIKAGRLEPALVAP
jgi:molybdopterin/thiamine biosynthesis adenylyltransferase